MKSQNFLKQQEINKQSFFLLFNNLTKTSLTNEQKLLLDIDFIPNTRINDKYLTLLNYSINSLNFKNIKISLEHDFINKKVLLIILNAIQKTSLKIYTNKSEDILFFKKIKLKMLINLFLNQIRYDEEIWFFLKKYQQQKINNKYTLNWNFLFLYINTKIINNDLIKLKISQKKLLIKIINLKLLDENKYFDKMVYHSPKLAQIIGLFKIYKQMLEYEKNKISAQKQYESLKYSTINQMIVFFLKQNLV